MDIRIAAARFSAGIFDSHYTFRGQTVTKPRRVCDFELEFYDEDGGTTFVDGRGCPIRAGMMLCACPGVTRYSELPLKTYYLKLREVGEPLASALRALPVYAPVPDGVDAPARVREILDAVSAGNTLAAAAGALSLLSRLIDGSDRARRLEHLPQEKSRAAVSRGIAYIEAHFRERCTLSDVAEHVHFSPVYFHGLFETALGKTPYEYLTDLRIEEAKRLLLTERLDVRDVAERCGFSSQSYFNYAFRRATGETPTAFRRAALARYLREDGK